MANEKRLNNKEYAAQMRTKAVADPGVIRVSTELWGQIADIIENSAEVVRCKDCKHCKKYRNRLDPMLNHQLCVRMDAYGWGVEDDDFCSYGERREGE